ncbi:MAG: DUF2069 domain-containing protein [Thioalkalispiraceae bacterium]|jgi:uncharacterized membrane protein
MMNKIALIRWLTLTGYGLLILLLMMWYGVWSPSTLPKWLVLFFLLLPLMFPLLGMLQGKLYTHAWMSMLILFYFIHGVGEAWTTPQDRSYAIAEIILSLLIYIGSMSYVKLAAKQNR